MSTRALPVHVALVDQTGRIDRRDLQTAAAALGHQVVSDFAPVWHVSATVAAYDQAPEDTWTIFIQEELDEPGALGYHTDDHRQPLSYVELTSEWTITCSHELLEMLADPWGNRVHTAKRPAGIPGYQGSERVRYMLEVCDPCEAISYEVGGVPVSDFLLPHWYRTLDRRNDQYTMTGDIGEPRTLANGGYVSWQDIATKHWWQAFDESAGVSLQDLGIFDGQTASLREWTDQSAQAFRAPVE